MVSIAATMVVGAVLNATAFVGGSALARSLGSKHVDEERIRHDKALEAYELEMGEWRKKQEEYQDWLAQKRENELAARSNLQDTDYSFKIFAKTHATLGAQPKLTWKPSSDQKKWEIAYVGGGTLVSAVIASKLL